MTNFVLLKPISKKWKKFVTTFMPYAGLARASFAVIAWLSSITFAKGGVFTTDFCFYTLITTVFLCATLNSTTLVWYREDMALLYNRTVTLHRKFVGISVVCEANFDDM